MQLDALIIVKQLFVTKSTTRPNWIVANEKEGYSIILKWFWFYSCVFFKNATSQFKIQMRRCHVVTLFKALGGSLTFVMIFSVTNCELLVLSFVVKSGVFTQILSNIANPLHYNNVRPLLVWYGPESPDLNLKYV